MNPILQVITEPDHTLHACRCVHCNGLFESATKAMSCESCAEIWSKPPPPFDPIQNSIADWTR